MTDTHAPGQDASLDALAASFRKTQDAPAALIDLRAKLASLSSEDIRQCADDSMLLYDSGALRARNISLRLWRDLVLSSLRDIRNGLGASKDIVDQLRNAIDIGVRLRHVQKTQPAQFDSLLRDTKINLEKARVYIRIADKLSPQDHLTKDEAKNEALSAIARDFATRVAGDWSSHDSGGKLWEMMSASDRERLADLRQWLIAATFELQRPQGISYPRFAEHWSNRFSSRPTPHIFLMTHNWGAAFAGDHDFDDHASEFRLPAHYCCFDFAISGRRVLALVREGAPEKITAQIECKPTWFALDPAYDALQWADIDGLQERAGLEKLRSLLLTNIKAACISLEAKIAEIEVVRAPHKLNAARERRGKLPISDYHVINLARRQRVEPLPLEHKLEAYHRSPRLHFRRGHWRHFVNHKTWINWTLVGHPDLGFIDKHYRL